LLQWKSIKYHIFLRVCTGSLRYPACNAHVPYCHLWPVKLSSFFFTILPHKHHDFQK